MKLEQLEHIIEIDKQKSISKAAKALYIGQSTLSGSLANLEAELGVRLFERTTFGMVPTNEGAEAIHLAKHMLDFAQQMYDLGKQEDELSGTVTVAIGYAYGFLVKDLMLRFKEKHPKAELLIKFCSPRQMLNGLTDGDLNIVVALLPRIHAGQAIINNAKRNIRSEVFGQYAFRVYVGKDSEFASQPSVSFNEIKEKSFVSNSSDHWEQIRPLFTPGKEILEVSDRELLKQLVSECDYVALLPELFLRQDVYIQQGLIKELEIQNSVIPDVEMNLLYAAQQQLTLLERSTIDLLREILKETE